MVAVPSPSRHPAPPRHVAIIMDGNGRWAINRGLPRTAGHRKGVEAVRTTVEAAIEIGIDYLTLFGFSSENWRRPNSEINDLMGLLRHYLRGELTELHKAGVRVRVIGDLARFDEDIVTSIRNAETYTRKNVAINVTIALSYGGRQDIVAAARALAREVQAGRLDAEAIDEAALDRHLSTAGIPDPDLIIRTSGEQRISNFLLWQSAYAEFVFLDTLWPDFGKADLAAAISEFHRRERRYGASMG
jgi:undecaprenyl diphosphate synthase